MKREEISTAPKMYVKILLKNAANSSLLFLLLSIVKKRCWSRREVKVEIRCVKINKKLRAKNFLNFIPTKFQVESIKCRSFSLFLPPKLHEITSVYMQ